MQKIVATLTEVGSELIKQAELVRDGAVPLADEEQERACEVFGEARFPLPAIPLLGAASISPFLLTPLRRETASVANA